MTLALRENGLKVVRGGSALLALSVMASCAQYKPNSEAICDGVERFLNRHADALLDGRVPDDVVVSGAALIASIDAACGF